MSQKLQEIAQAARAQLAEPLKQYEEANGLWGLDGMRAEDVLALAGKFKDTAENLIKQIEALAGGGNT